MHQKVSSSCVYDIWSVKVQRGQNQKSQLNIQKSCGWDFKKIKGRKDAGVYLNVPYSEALCTKASVESLFGLFLEIQNKKNANGTPK